MLVLLKKPHFVFHRMATSVALASMFKSKMLRCVLLVSILANFVCGPTCIFYTSQKQTFHKIPLSSPLNIPFWKCLASS